MTNDCENWEQIQALFHLAEATAEADRERFLEQHCADARVRARVMEILTAAQAEDPPHQPPSITGMKAKVGPYTLLRHLGSGGIGSVYLAERLVGAVVQRTALKMLAPHAAGPQFVERFRREQHILFSMDHANITRMLDAGLDENGQPYLVMEYVDGVHLDAYCDEHRLAIPERLRLFLNVCAAVAYAHRNLVVHLDLKPANVLITKEGSVKLLDFGTSKLIQPDSLLTTTIMATPAYASPEQLRNEPVTTACDVYALGAILFELLSGHRPGEKASVAVMIERAMKQQEPERLPKAVTGPAAAHRGVSEGRSPLLLSADLATIAARCLSPQPRERYASVDALAADIEFYLADRPIVARAPTPMYRATKFVRRNRGSVTAATAIVIALLAAIAYGEWQQQQALREGQRALRMQTFMYSLFKLANSSYTGKPAATVREFLQLGVTILPEYIKDPGDLRKAQMSMAESMLENGDLDDAQKVFAQTTASAKASGDIDAQAESEAFAGNIAYINGQLDVGARLTQDALRLSRQRGVTPAVRVWSDVYFAQNRDNNGFRSDENLLLLESAVKEAQDHHLPERETASAMEALGEDLQVRGLLDESDRKFHAALQVYGQDPSTLCEQAEIYGDLAYSRETRGDVAGSLPLYQQSYDGYRGCSGAESRAALAAQSYLAGVLIKLGRPAEAVTLLENALPVWRKVAGSSPDLSQPLFFLSRGYIATQRYAEAEKTAKECMAVQANIAPTDRRIGATHMLWAQALAGQVRYRDALPHAMMAAQLLSEGHSPGARQMDAEAHQLLLQVQSKLPETGSSQ